MDKSLELLVDIALEITMSYRSRRDVFHCSDITAFSIELVHIPEIKIRVDSQRACSEHLSVHVGGLIKLTKNAVAEDVSILKFQVMGRD